MQTALILTFALATAAACGAIAQTATEILRHHAAIRRALRLIRKGEF